MGKRLKDSTEAERLAASGYTLNDDGSVTIPTRGGEESADVIKRNYLSRVIWVPPLPDYDDLSMEEEA